MADILHSLMVINLNSISEHLDITGIAELPKGVEMVMPGDNIKMTIKLIYPVALEEGLRFAIREGGRTVGSGVISKIIE